MADSRRQRLIDLGADVLADALLELAGDMEEAGDLIERLIATPKDNVRRFKKKLSALRRSERFYDWCEAGIFARELKSLLSDLKSGVEDPLAGAELVASFYEADDEVFERCDDSDGDVGDVFRHEARALFFDYAGRCGDKEKIADIILKLNQKDSYCVRRVLVDCAGECLSEDVIRTMIATLQKWADGETDAGRRHGDLSRIESLARQIKDAKLFEKTCLAAQGKTSSSAFLDIARVYFECGDAGAALAWLKKIPEGEAFRAYERDRLLDEIYRRQGDSEKLAGLLYKNFISGRSAARLQALVQVIGQDRRDEIVRDEIPKIMKLDAFSMSDAKFLIDVGKIDEAEQYLLKRSDHLNGGYYCELLPMAEAMEEEKRYLVASLIYRSLLVSILERGFTRAYRHGARYLRKLDRLAANIADWKGFHHHDDFKAQIAAAHGRKRSFWSEYAV